MKIIEKELLSEIKQDKAIEEQHGGLSFKLHETSTMWKILSSTKTTGQAQEEASHQEEGGEEEDLRRSKIMTQEIHTFTADIMGEVTTLKLAQKLENIARIQQEKTMMNIASQYRISSVKTSGNRSSYGSTAKPNPDSAISTGTVVMATFATVFPSISGDSNHSVAATNSRNVAATTSQFSKVRFKFKRP
jgi:hypothetical protein